MPQVTRVRASLLLSTRLLQFWGQPELYPINGTNNGATVRGRNERVATLANLPVCVDEITHMPAKDAVDLAMSITQPGHRIRLDTTGIERANLESYKATIMLSTGNNSLHGLLSTDNAAGTAGSMRVFEMRFKPTGVHTKAQADDYLHELKQNYGHFGELFVQYVMKNLPAVQARVRELVREIDAVCASSRPSASGRARSPRCSSPARSPSSWAFISYDLAALRQWIVTEQVPEMRGIVKEEYSDPLGIVTDYLETISANMLVMEKLPTRRSRTSSTSSAGRSARCWRTTTPTNRSSTCSRRASRTIAIASGRMRARSSTTSTPRAKAAGSS
jgi:hypothetical protein